MSTSPSVPYTFTTVINDNRCNLQPPVCNKMLHNEGPLKVMIVGGPNVRKDYHINEGEEIFYQIEGDMVLKVMEQGEPRDVTIKQGEVFVLPGGVPHSPQRFENTVGVVIERGRDQDREYDGLRYYVDETNTEILWQRYFHCQDLGKELVPLIKSFFDSEECKTRAPTDSSVMEKPFEDNVRAMLRPPYPLATRFPELVQGSKPIKLGDSKDFVAEVCGNGSMTPAMPIETEVWIWQMVGQSSIDGGAISLKEGECVLLPKGLKEWTLGVSTTTPSSSSVGTTTATTKQSPKLTAEGSSVNNENISAINLTTSTTTTGEANHGEVVSTSSDSNNNVKEVDTDANAVASPTTGVVRRPAIAMLIYTTVVVAHE